MNGKPISKFIQDLQRQEPYIATSVDPRPPLRFLDTQAVQDSYRFGAALGRLDLARGTHSFTACQEAFQKGYLSVTEPEPIPPHPI